MGLVPVTPGVARGCDPWFEIGVPALAVIFPGWLGDTPARVLERGWFIPLWVVVA